jgi:hypothetical protein
MPDLVVTLEINSAAEQALYVGSDLAVEMALNGVRGLTGATGDTGPKDRKAQPATQDRKDRKDRKAQPATQDRKAQPGRPDQQVPALHLASWRLISGLLHQMKQAQP